MNAITEELEQRRAMLAAIIDSSEDAIISKNLNSIITSWNNAAERMFGYTESEVVGKHIFILIPEELRGEEEMIISNLRQGRRIEHYQTLRLTKSGHKLPISLTISPIKNSANVIIGASKIARDITRQKKDEALIKQYAYQLEVINSIGKSISLQLDLTMILQAVIDATVQLTGSNSGIFLYNNKNHNNNTSFIHATSGISTPDLLKQIIPGNISDLKKVFRNGIFRSNDITKDDQFRKIFPEIAHTEPVRSYLALPVFSQNRDIIGGLFFEHSETDKFKEEDEKMLYGIASQAGIALDNAQLYEEINTLNAKKDEFIGFASHELKTPLTTITGYLQLAETNPELAIDFFPKINKQVTRLKTLIADLLDISKIQAGRLDFNFASVSLHGLIQESIEAVNHHDHIFEFEGLAEDLMITVDKQKMTQVLTNILSNAVKYSPAGSKISVITVRFGEQVKISIQDQGFGIAPQHLEKIFSQFYRISKLSNKIEGTGLGLFISREIMKQHLGRIWVESEEGKGSVFYIVFPVETSKLTES